jgi:hypothetical protein
VAVSITVRGTSYELRHTAISTSLHSTLVMTKDGMNLRTLASVLGHSCLQMGIFHDDMR